MSKYHFSKFQEVILVLFKPATCTTLHNFTIDQCFMSFFVNNKQTAHQNSRCDLRILNICKIFQFGDICLN